MKSNTRVNPHRKPSQTLADARSALRLFLEPERMPSVRSGSGRRTGPAFFNDEGALKQWTTGIHRDRPAGSGAKSRKHPVFDVGGSTPTDGTSGSSASSLVQSIWNPGSAQLLGQGTTGSYGQQVLSLLEQQVRNAGLTMPEFLVAQGYGPFDRQAYISDWANTVFGDLTMDRVGQGIPGYADLNAVLGDFLTYADSVSQDILNQREGPRQTVSSGEFGSGLSMEDIQRMIQEAVSGSWNPAASAQSYYY